MDDPHPFAPSGRGGKRIVVMASGNGSNLQALIDACADGRLKAAVVGVIVNRRDAYARERAAQAGIPCEYLPLKPYTEAGRPRADYDADVAERVAAYSPDLIVLAGWMHVLSSAFLDRFPGKVINLHPALPGMFAGTHAIERTFEAYQRGEVTGGGIMVHVVAPEVDAGPVIAQAEAPILPDDTLETFEARLHAAEHALLVEATRRALGG
ncbi:MAG: phosphoribosylglycinamide formyltransferase [Anaerolineae bacterium]|nr:MAG: phosphoribosylglycinamide formyltransferase [Chloroflexi bacterium OLB13]MBW7879663.1 phosphoribosylglycinamide formyltransferase [Anaerolineae bacterium]